MSLSIIALLPAFHLKAEGQETAVKGRQALQNLQVLLTFANFSFDHIIRQQCQIFLFMCAVYLKSVPSYPLIRKGLKF